MASKIKLYGSRISYYTGKIEGYLQYKEIPHDFVVLNPNLIRMLKEDRNYNRAFRSKV
jgi:hypothetical protein